MSAAATPPGLPPGKTADAETFLRYWIDTLDYAAKTGDTGALMAVSSPDCVQCGGIIRFIRSVYAKDGKIVGAGWRFIEVAVISRHGGSLVASVRVKVNHQRVTTRKGGRATIYLGGTATKVFHVSRRNRWHVTRLDQPQ